MPSCILGTLPICKRQDHSLEDVKKTLKTGSGADFWFFLSSQFWALGAGSLLPEHFPGAGCEREPAPVALTWNSQWRKARFCATCGEMIVLPYF